MSSSHCTMRQRTIQGKIDQLAASPILPSINRMKKSNLVSPIILVHGGYTYILCYVVGTVKTELHSTGAQGSSLTLPCHLTLLLFAL